MVGSFEVGRFVMCVVHDIHDKVIMYCMACAICIARRPVFGGTYYNIIT